MSEEGRYSEDSHNSITEQDTNGRTYNSIFEIKESQRKDLNLTQIVQKYEDVTQNNDDDGHAWTVLGHCYYVLKDFHKCYAAYQKALYILQDNRDSELWYGIGCLYNQFKLYQFSEPAFQAVLKIDPNYPYKHIVCYKLGLIYQINTSYANSEDYLKQSLIGDHFPAPKTCKILQKLAEVYQAQNKIDQAIQAFEQATQIDSSSVCLLQQVGWARYQKGEYQVALEKFNQALGLTEEDNPFSADLNYLIGRCQLQMKKLKEGQNSFQKAIYKRPHSYIAWCSIGVLYAVAGQHYDAYDCFVKATAMGNDKGEAWYNMGLLYERCNQKQEAVLAYQRSLMLDSTIYQAEYRKNLLARGQDPEPSTDFLIPTIKIGQESFLLKDEQEHQSDNRNEEVKKAEDSVNQSLPRIPQLGQTPLTPGQPSPIQPQQMQTVQNNLQQNPVVQPDGGSQLNQLSQIAQLLQLMQAGFNGINIQQLLSLLQSSISQSTQLDSIQQSNAYSHQGNQMPLGNQQLPVNQFPNYMPPQQQQPNQMSQLPQYQQNQAAGINQLSLQQIHQLQQLQNQLISQTQSQTQSQTHSQAPNSVHQQAYQNPAQQLNPQQSYLLGQLNQQMHQLPQQPNLHQSQQVKQDLRQTLPTQKAQYNIQQPIPSMDSVQPKNGITPDQQRQPQYNQQMLNAMMFNNQVNQMRYLQARMMQQAKNQQPFQGKPDEDDGVEAAEALAKLAESARQKRRGDDLEDGLPKKKKK